MKKILLAFVLTFVFTIPIYAESAHEICAQEVRDVGVEDQEEKDLYMKECLSQVNAEMESSEEAGEAETENNSDTPRSEES